MAVWLDHRTQRWPATADPHLLINVKIAVGVGCVSDSWVNTTLDLSAQAVREDRIFDEAAASGGDVRRLCDLFGLSVKAAERYASAVNSLTLPDVTQRVDAGTGAPLQGTDGGMPGAASSIGVDMQP